MSAARLAHRWAEKMSKKMKCLIPEKIGLVFDPHTPAVNIGSLLDASTMFLINICDQLLTYDCIQLRCDFDTVSMLYRGITCDELEPLFKNKKILFYAPVSGGRYASPQLENDNGLIDKKFINDLEKCLIPFQDALASGLSKILNQIEYYSVESQVINTNLSLSIIEKFLSGFNKNHFKDWHRIGLETGISNILDIWSTGTFNVHFDKEMNYYLKSCISFKDEFYKKIQSPSENNIESLHSIGNIPSIKDQIIKKELTTKEFVKLVLGDEVHELQKWLRKNITPGLDVRDFYYQSLSNLPSKSKWAKWLRFGSATTLSFVLGLFLSGNPALAAILGIGIGLTDTAGGDKLTEFLFDPYHPRDYIGHFTGKQ